MVASVTQLSEGPGVYRNVVGEHNGVHLWTIGQRIRLGVQGPQLGNHHSERG